jgi:Ala-tRNA(Pro) deacylase
MKPETPPPAGPAELLAVLAGLGIPAPTVDHAAVFTVAEAKALRGELPGAHTKSLFLRNKKGVMWLVVAREDRIIDLRRLGDQLGSGRLSFASPERLQRHLGVIPGAVSPFAVINDRDRVVTVVLDADLREEDPLNFHPLDNTMTTAISWDDLLRFLQAHDHPPAFVDFAA